MFLIHLIMTAIDAEESGLSMEEVNWPTMQAVRTHLLLSAVETCQLPFYEGKYLKAAALFRSLVKNHAFVDGNKRTAALSLIVFLAENGCELLVTDDELVRFTLRVAKGYEKIYQIKSWIKHRCRNHEPDKNCSNKSHRRGRAISWWRAIKLQFSSSK